MNGWPSITPNYQQFAFFFTAAFAVGALLLVHRAWRDHWPLVPWLVIILWGATFGLIGSKLILIPVSGWLEGFANRQLPPTDQKTLLGGLLGIIAGLELCRRWLGFRWPVADAYAIVIPLAIAVGRIGCLVVGCCFGTPSRLPWAISYGPGSDALAAHLARGLVPPGAASSLPVHPLQLYDIILMLGLALLLLKARPHLKRRGSLLLCCLVVYGIIRFGEEFIRESGSPVAGLKTVQWGLLAAVAVALALLIIRERRTAPSPEAAPRPIGRLRIALALGVVLIAIVAAYGWFTPLERAVVNLHLVMLAAVLVRSRVPEERRALIRRGAVTLAAGSALMLQGDSTPKVGPTSYYSLYGAGTGGAYTEVCGGYRRFASGGVGLSRTRVYNRDSRLEYGLRGYLGDADGSGYLSANPYLSFDSRWVGGGFGIHAMFDPLSGGGGLGVLPQGHLRFGPRRIAFLEAGILDHVLGGLTQPLARVGLGREFKNGTSVLAGMAFLTGPFIEANIKAGDRFDLTPYVSYLPMGRYDPPSYQLGLALRYRLGR